MVAEPDRNSGVGVEKPDHSQTSFPGDGPFASSGPVPPRICIEWNQVAPARVHLTTSHLPSGVGRYAWTTSALKTSIETAHAHATATLTTAPRRRKTTSLARRRFTASFYGAVLLCVSTGAAPCPSRPGASWRSSWSSCEQDTVDGAHGVEGFAGDGVGHAVVEYRTDRLSKPW